MRVVLKIGKKGVLVLPKRLREVIGLVEGGEVLVEVEGDRLVLKALKPKVVDIDPVLVEELLREEYGLENSRYRRMVSSGETGS